jgi:hypothetical protein
MRLLERLQDQASTDDSIFRRQLAKEDLARLEILRRLATQASDLEAFRKEGKYIGWTQGDMRTHDLRETLDKFLDAFFSAARTPDPNSEATLEAAWITFHNDRMEKLVHCL